MPLISNDYVAENEDALFSCPACQADLEMRGSHFHCQSCAYDFENTDGIDQLYWPNHWEGDKHDVTQEVKAFYEESPFPNYDEFDNLDSLASKAKRGVFARLLDEQIPAGARIIEVGAGTSQLSNFLAIKNRKVIAADLCLNSLRLGRDFAQRHDLQNIRFVQMNLFRPPFKKSGFHLVISNGVLHHTSDPRAGFESIAELVKPGGYILIGLYHYWGRLITDIRRIIFNLSGDRFKTLDPNLKNQQTSGIKKDAWFNDQYKHPHESKHTIREILDWLDKAGFEFVRSIPSAHLFKDFTPNEQLFSSEAMPGNAEALLREMGMFFKGSQEGGFFTIIGKKKIHK